MPTYSDSQRCNAAVPDVKGWECSLKLHHNGRHEAWDNHRVRTVQESAFEVPEYEWTNREYVIHEEVLS